MVGTTMYTLTVKEQHIRETTQTTLDVDFSPRTFQGCQLSVFMSFLPLIFSNVTIHTTQVGREQHANPALS